MQEEIETLHRNKTWNLDSCSTTTRQEGHWPKWVYKIQRDSNDLVEWYCTRLAVKGYA